MSARDLVPVRRALISVSDKTGLAEFAAALAAHGVEIVSTGGSARTIAEAGVPVREVSELTGFPEMMDGRVKTLHPAVHGAILARRDHPGDREAMAAHGIGAIDLVAVNLYPFEATVASGAARRVLRGARPAVAGAGPRRPPASALARLRQRPRRRAPAGGAGRGAGGAPGARRARRGRRRGGRGRGG